jgi:hypothetical protein
LGKLAVRAVEDGSTIRFEVRIETREFVQQEIRDACSHALP